MSKRFIFCEKKLNFIKTFYFSLKKGYIDKLRTRKTHSPFVAKQIQRLLQVC